MTNQLSVPDHWQIGKIKKLIKKVPLTGIKLKKRDYEEIGKYPVIDQGQDFIGGYTDKELVVPCELPVIVFGDHTKEIKYIDFSFVAGADGIKVLKPKDVFEPKLFYYFLQAVQLPDKGYARHYQYLEKEFIPIPPLTEQINIVSKIEELFSQLDAGVAGLKRAQAELKRYRASVLKAAFEGRLVPQDPNDEPAIEILHRMGKDSIIRDELIPLPENWAWTTLGSVTHPERNRVQPSDFPNAKYIGMADVESMTMKLLSTRLASDMKSTAETFKSGDVLYGSLRPYLNKVISPQFDGLCSTEFIVFPKTSHLNNDYLRIFLNTSEFVAYSNSLNTGDRPRVKFEQFQDYPFPYPPIKEQERIVDTLEKHISIIQSLEEMIAENFVRTQTIKQSVLSRAFEGKLMHGIPDDSTKNLDINDELENTNEQNIFIQESLFK